MNYKIVFKLLGLIAFIITGGLAISLMVGFFMEPAESRASDHTLRGFLIAIAISFSVGLIFRIAGRGEHKKIFLKEAFAVIGLGWILASALSTLPYILVGDEMDIGDIVFEATSGITTTGASALSNLEDLPAGLMFWRQFSQWMGGLGVVVFFVAILGSLGVGGKVLFANESTSNPGDLEVSRAREGARNILYLYLALSFACALGYLLAGLGLYDAFCHMFTTVSTAGFSTRSESLGAFQSAGVEWVAITFMLLGGTNFVFLMALTRGRFTNCHRHTEVKAYYGMIVAATLYISGWLALTAQDPSSWHDTIRTAAFQVVSISTTTGYSTVDFGQWATPVISVLILLMVIGGCSGSTAGGSKMIRLVVIIKLIRHSLEKSFRPNLVRPIRINGKQIDMEGRDAVMQFFLLNILILGASFILLSAFEPDLDPFSTIMAVVACLFNIGPGLGAVGPTENFGFLNPHSKIFLSFLMILGRLEFFAILILFFPSLWKNFQ